MNRLFKVLHMAFIFFVIPATVVYLSGFQDGSDRGLNYMMFTSLCLLVLIYSFYTVIDFSLFLKFSAPASMLMPLGFNLGASIATGNAIIFYMMLTCHIAACFSYNKKLKAQESTA